MATAADTLHAIEARAERAIVQKLRLIKQEILGLRSRLVPDDRTHADAVLLKRHRLESEQIVAAAGKDMTPVMLMPSLRMETLASSCPAVYRVSF